MQLGPVGRRRQREASTGLAEVAALRVAETIVGIDDVARRGQSARHRPGRREIPVLGRRRDPVYQNDRRRSRIDPGTPVDVAQPVQSALAARRVGHAEADRGDVHPVAELHLRCVLTATVACRRVRGERRHAEKNQKSDHGRSTASKHRRKAAQASRLNPAVGGSGRKPGRACRHQPPPLKVNSDGHANRSPLSAAVPFVKTHASPALCLMTDLPSRGYLGPRRALIVSRRPKNAGRTPGRGLRLPYCPERQPAQPVAHRRAWTAGRDAGRQHVRVGGGTSTDEDPSPCTTDAETQTALYQYKAGT